MTEVGTSGPGPAASGQEQPPEPGVPWFPVAVPAALSDEDLLALLDSLGVDGTHDPEGDQEAIAEAEWRELQAGEPAAGQGSTASPAWIGEHLPAGPGLAAVLAPESAGGASDWDLPGMAAGYRRLAAWAQSRELAAVAEVAARRAAANPDIGASEDGRPCQLPPEAAAEVALELRMSQYGASAWTDLGCQLRWRLPATFAALAAGVIDLGRARIIAEATGLLSDEHAAAVEQRVLPAAGEQTTGQLRAAVRRAVLAIDPEGAEERRKGTERQAKVSLYPDEDGTATLTGRCLPGIQAAAAMARITALARALKASGAGGGLDLLRAHIFTGLLLGTLPLIPPPAHGPPDPPPPPDDQPPDDQPPAEDGPADPPLPPEDEPSAKDGPFDPAPPSDDQGLDDQPPAENGPADPPPSDDPPPAGGGVPGESCGAAGDGTCGCGRPGTGAPAAGPASPSSRRRDDTPPAGPAAAADGTDDPFDADGLPGWWPGIPCPGDADAPPDTGDPPGPPVTTEPDDADDDWPLLPSPDWPALPARLPATGDPAPAAGDAARARAGLLDVLLPWSSLAGHSSEPGILGRIGPISSLQAQQLLHLAALSPQTQWRVIVTGDDGRALAVERARPPRHPLARPADPDSTGMIGRVTITIRASALTTPGGTGGCPLLLRGIAAAVLAAARRAAARAAADAERDTAAGGCAHTTASAAYRPPRRLREHIAARDKTCRFGPCGQPAWRTDIDHTIPWHNGGLTCQCNLGGCCRTHHLIKHLPGWQLDQPQPGTFRWTTPAGRDYQVRPDPYPV